MSFQTVGCYFWWYNRRRKLKHCRLVFLLKMRICCVLQHSLYQCWLFCRLQQTCMGSLRMLRQNQHRILKISLKLGYLCTNKSLCPVSFLDFTGFSLSETGIVPLRCLTDSKPVANTVLLNVALQFYVDNKCDNNTWKWIRMGSLNWEEMLSLHYFEAIAGFSVTFSQMFLKWQFLYV